MILKLEIEGHRAPFKTIMQQTVIFQTIMQQTVIFHQFNPIFLKFNIAYLPCQDNCTLQLVWVFLIMELIQTARSHLLEKNSKI